MQTLAAFAVIAASAALGLVACDSCDSWRSARAQAEPAPPAPTVPSPVPAAKLRVQEAPASGDVDAIVRDAQAAAERDHRRVVVYVGATWCEPCQRFHHAAEEGELDAQFPDVDLLVFDADRDGGRLQAAGYAWKKYIPYFALPGPDGRASGKEFEGGIKGEGAVSHLTPRLLGLLRQ
jgi:hypothetical protein